MSPNRSRPGGRVGNLLIGVSGSIHATFLPAYIVNLRPTVAKDIRLILTSDAQRFVSCEALKWFVDGHVYVDPYERDANMKPWHITLNDWADAFLVLPASANTISKAAHGIADNLLSLTILGSTVPIDFAPAMNASMWKSKSLQRNLSTLLSDGHRIIDPKPAHAFGSGASNRDGFSPDLNSIISHYEKLRTVFPKEAGGIE